MSRCTGTARRCIGPASGGTVAPLINRALATLAEGELRVPRMDTSQKSSHDEFPEAAEKCGGSGLLSRFRTGLRRTHARIASSLHAVLTVGRKLDGEVVRELEEQLYVADVGPRTVTRLCEGIMQAHRTGEIKQSEQVMAYLREQIKENLRQWDTALHLPQEGVGVIFVAGVNGSGKTTSIGKLAHKFGSEGKKVLLAACDTFRAAAVEQLSIWAQWAGADIVKNERTDPASVAFDAADRAQAGGYDVLIADTAGRVHTRRNLMMELQKIKRVIANKIPGAPHETLIVLDATTGQNAISQAIRFNEAVSLTGIILAKLDGTAKGGIVFGMRDQIDIPVKLVGLGQRPEDLAPFDADDFVDALFE